MTIGSNKHRNGFTIVELSIVIVIIGLIIGAVLGGKSLIRATEMRGVMTDTNQYITAINNFKQQYRYLPGDFNRATSYWANPSASVIVTNGDGNGQVSGGERYAAWLHLNLAGFIEGVYTGAQGAGGSDDFVYIDTKTTPANIPAGRLKNSGYAFYYTDNSAGSAYVYAVPAANVLTFAAGTGTNGGPPGSNVSGSVIINPQDAYMIDTKMDDGMPGTGVWIANLTGGTGFGLADACTLSGSASDYTGTFNLSVKKVKCSFFIYGGW